MQESPHSIPTLFMQRESPRSIPDLFIQSLIHSKPTLFMQTKSRPFNIIPIHAERVSHSIPHYPIHAEIIVTHSISTLFMQRESLTQCQPYSCRESRSSLNTNLIHEQRVSRSPHSIPTLCTQRESLTQYQPCSCRESPSLNSNPIHAERVTHSISTLLMQRESLTQCQTYS